MSYTNWDQNQPTNSKNQECVGLNLPGTSAMKWSAGDCNQKHHFICEKFSGKPLNSLTLNAVSTKILSCDKFIIRTSIKENFSKTLYQSTGEIPSLY